MDGMDCELGKVGVECQVGVALLSVCVQKAAEGRDGRLANRGAES